MIKICAICGKTFDDETRSKARKYCSPECLRERKIRSLREWRERLRQDPEEYQRYLEYCRAANKAIRESAPEKYREYQRAYQARNREQIRERGREYYNAHREERRLKRRQHYWAHREEILEKHRLEKLDNVLDWDGLIVRDEEWRKC